MRPLSGWCGAAQEIRFTAVRLYHRILQNAVVNGCDENHLRNILNLSQVRMRSVSEEKELAGTDPKNLRVFRDFWFWSGCAAVAASSIAPRDHRLSETVNIEKVGRTYFFNMFRNVISFYRLVMTKVCKLCPREQLPPHFAKSGGKRLR